MPPENRNATLTGYEPLAGMTLSGEDVIVRGLPHSSRYNLRCPARDAQEFAQQTGWRLGTAPLTATVGLLGAALHLGPDEWLLIGSSQVPGTPSSSPAVVSVLHSIVDISHRHCAMSVVGANAAALLASGCPLDLSDRAFPVDRCSRTVFARVEITVWKTETNQFHVEFSRSLSEYLWRYLAIAAKDL